MAATVLSTALPTPDVSQVLPSDHPVMLRREYRHLVQTSPLHRAANDAVPAAGYGWGDGRAHALVEYVISKEGDDDKFPSHGAMLKLLDWLDAEAKKD